MPTLPATGVRKGWAPRCERSGGLGVRGGDPLVPLALHHPHDLAVPDAGHRHDTGGLKEKPAEWRRTVIMLNTLLFVFGFALAFTAAGGAAGAVESLFDQARRPLEIVGGVLIVCLL